MREDVRGVQGEPPDIDDDNPFGHAQLLSHFFEEGRYYEERRTDFYNAISWGVEGAKRRYIDGHIDAETMERWVGIALRAAEASPVELRVLEHKAARGTLDV